MPETIIYGTVYNIFHDEYNSDELFEKVVGRDMEAIRDANFNLVMPFPFGQWDSETRKQDWKRTDYLVKKLEENELMLFPIMLKSTHRAYLPTWKWLEIEDGIREFPQVSRSNEDVKYMHPEILKSIDDYFASVVQRYGKSPSLVGYNIWNETHYESIDEITIPKFRNWLKKKYGTLSELNRVWADDYTSWDQITPLLRRNWESSMSVIDWDLFRFSNNGDIAQWCYTTMRKYDPHRFMTTNTVGTVINNPDKNQWSVDGRQIAPHTDVFGISFYPDKYYNINKKPMPYWMYNCVYDVTRCDAGDKPFFLVEAQTNQQNGMGLFQFLNYHDIHLMSWLAFADDCKGIIFWKWKPFYRGQQAFGRGLVMANGELSPRGQAAKDVGAVLKDHGKLLHGSKMKPAEAAILYDIVALHKSLEAAERPAGGHEAAHTTGYFMNQSFEGTYKALWDKNISVDIIRTDMPFTLQMLKKYKILYLPYQLVIRHNVAELLKSFVAEGGTVVADARTAIMDEFDFGYMLNPGAGLHELFGARRLDLFAAENAFDVKLTSGAEFKTLHSGFNYQGIYFREKLELLQDGKTIAEFTDTHEPALVANHWGKGMAFLSAVPLGGSNYNGKSASGEILSDLALKAGVKPTATLATENQGIVVKVHTTNNNDLLVYVVNTSDSVYKGEITVPDALSEFKKAKNLTNEQTIDFQKNAGNLHFTLELAEKRTAILWFTK
ncbi:MAG: beta-galactosidase [Prolixibacteraceae bacterium]|nr:beta-galactosidase [Prolixibacteraceae bacterium]